MNARHLLSVALLACASAAAPLPKHVAGPVAGPVVGPVAGPVVGDYVEARTASVFAGACHYNGERVTTGNQAVAAWHVTGGTWNGTDLAGVTAVAAVSSPSNLADPDPARSCELVVDARSAAQATAMADLLRSTCGGTLGRVAAVRRGAVTFRDDAHAYTVAADGFASMSVRPMPNNECCSQPHLVWYAPLTPLDGRKVGYTTVASYDAGTGGETWQRADENSAFYGSFALRPTVAAP